jgi:hypothetical protein
MDMIEVLRQGWSKRSGPTMVGPGSMKETNVQGSTGVKMYEGGNKGTGVQMYEGGNKCTCTRVGTNVQAYRCTRVGINVRGWEQMYEGEKICTSVSKYVRAIPDKEWAYRRSWE